MGDLKSACWHSDGLQFVTGHADGSTCVWSVDNAARPTQVKKFYGEYLRCEGRSRREEEKGREGGSGWGEGRRGRGEGMRGRVREGVERVQKEEGEVAFRCGG